MKDEKIEVKMIKCPFNCYKGLAEKIGWVRDKTFYKCKKCDQQWSVDNVQSDV